MFLPHLSDHSARLYFMLILNVYHVNIVHVPSKKGKREHKKPFVYMALRTKLGVKDCHVRGFLCLI